ncbi:MFS transporter [Spiribacter halobius]
MGLLLPVSESLSVSVSAAGLLVSGYALGVVVGAPLLTYLMSRWRSKRVLLALMIIFTLGNAACALAPDYVSLMLARVITALAHGTYFGIGSVLATRLVPLDRRATAIAVMFTGLTLANILGVPFGTWLGHELGWRATFVAIAVVGALALGVIAALVPDVTEDVPDAGAAAAARVFLRPAVVLGMATTVLGYAGVFTVFTYIAPLLTRLTGVAEAALSPILLLFGLGLVAGNLLGGRFADKRLFETVTGTLLLLAMVLAVMRLALPNPGTAVLAVGLLGAAGFATVPPLQMWVLAKAEGAGQSLAASVNIAAFNLGNAFGAWLGGVVVDHGPGLRALPWVAAVLPLLAIALAFYAERTALDRRGLPRTCPPTGPVE